MGGKYGRELVRGRWTAACCHPCIFLRRIVVCARLYLPLEGRRLLQCAVAPESRRCEHAGTSILTNAAPLSFARLMALQSADHAVERNDVAISSVLSSKELEQRAYPTAAEVNPLRRISPQDLCNIVVPDIIRPHYALVMGSPDEEESLWAVLADVLQTRMSLVSEALYPFIYAMAFPGKRDFEGKGGSPISLFWSKARVP